MARVPHHFWGVGCRFDRALERDVGGRGGGGGVGGGEFLVGAGGGGGGMVGCEWVGVGVGWGGEGGGVGVLTGSQGGWGLAAGECRRGVESVRCYGGFGDFCRHFWVPCFALPVHRTFWQSFCNKKSFCGWGYPCMGLVRHSSYFWRSRQE